jgi:hypothetical protein
MSDIGGVRRVEVPAGRQILGDRAGAFLFDRKVSATWRPFQGWAPLELLTEPIVCAFRSPAEDWPLTQALDALRP